MTFSRFRFSDNAPAKPIPRLISHHTNDAATRRMPPTYREFKEHIRKLEQEAEQARRSELRQVVAELRKKIREYGITPDQLFGPDLSALVHFRDPETGKTWNGLGRPPNWIRGKDRDRFRVN